MNVLDGFYTASYDGNTFESAYTRITGISGDEVRIMPEADSTVRTEQTDGSAEETVCTERYIITGGGSERTILPEAFDRSLMLKNRIMQNR